VVIQPRAGSIPTEVGQLINLQLLSLMMNQLTGAIWRGTDQHVVYESTINKCAHAMRWQAARTQVTHLTRSLRHACRPLPACAVRARTWVPTGTGEFKTFMKSKVPACYIASV